MANILKQAKPIDDAIRDQYEQKFDPKFYLKTYFKDVHPLEEFTIRKLHDIFTTGALDGHIKRCIDIGCGPVVHRLSAPSKICETLVYSDFSSNNLKFVQDWLKGSDSDVRLEKMFKFCAQLEGFDDLEKGAIEIQNRIKSKTPSVHRINVLEPQHLDQLDLQPFDVAFSGACLEGACDTYESYVTAVKNVATLIRDDGYLILKGYLRGTFYRVNDLEFPCLTLSENMVKTALNEGGFKVLEFDVINGAAKIQMKINGKQCNNSDGSFFVLARKERHV